MPLTMGAKSLRALAMGARQLSGAGSGRNDGVFGLMDVLVYAVNDCGEVVARGSRDNNLLGAGVDVGLSLIMAV